MSTSAGIKKPPAPTRRSTLHGSSSSSSSSSSSGRSTSSSKLLTHTADHTLRRRSTVTVAKHGHKFAAGKSVSTLHHGKMLYEASRKGVLADVTQILESGTLPDEYKDREGMTALHQASLLGYHKVVKQLVKHGAQVTMQDKKGNTPLHWAAVLNRHKAVTALLNGGADTHMTDKCGKSALDLAWDKNHERVIELLDAAAPLAERVSAAEAVQAQVAAEEERRDAEMRQQAEEAEKAAKRKKREERDAARRAAASDDDDDDDDDDGNGDDDEKDEEDAQKKAVLLRLEKELADTAAALDAAKRRKEEQEEEEVQQQREKEREVAAESKRRQQDAEAEAAAEVERRRRRQRRHDAEREEEKQREAALLERKESEEKAKATLLGTVAKGTAEKEDNPSDDMQLLSDELDLASDDMLASASPKNSQEAGTTYSHLVPLQRSTAPSALPVKAGAGGDDNHNNDHNDDDDNHHLLSPEESFARDVAAARRRDVVRLSAQGQSAANAAAPGAAVSASGEDDSLGHSGRGILASSIVSSDGASVAKDGKKTQTAELTDKVKVVAVQEVQHVDEGGAKQAQRSSTPPAAPPPAAPFSRPSVRTAHHRPHPKHAHHHHQQEQEEEGEEETHHHDRLHKPEGQPQPQAKHQSQRRVGVSPPRDRMRIASERFGVVVDDEDEACEEHVHDGGSGQGRSAEPLAPHQHHNRSSRRSSSSNAHGAFASAGEGEEDAQQAAGGGASPHFGVLHRGPRRQVVQRGASSSAMQRAAAEHAPLSRFAASPRLQEEVRRSRQSMDVGALSRQAPDATSGSGGSGVDPRQSDLTGQVKDSKDELLDLLRELDLERLHSDLAEAAGGTSLHHLKTFAFSLAELESVASLGVPKIRARKLWRKVEVATTGSSLM